jgi:hypothetical protein
MGFFVEIMIWAWGKQYSAKKQALVRRFIKELESNRGKALRRN